MKTAKVLLACAAVLCTFLGCNDSKKAEVRWQAEKDSLISVSQDKQQMLDDLSLTLTEVAASLDSIAAGEDILRQASESKVLTKKEMLDKLSIFRELLEKNKERMSQLENRLVGKDKELAKMGRLVKHLNAELAAKERRIAELEEELNNANANIAMLQAQLGNFSTAMNELEEEKANIETTSNTAYYVAGTSKELKDAGIISGGFLKKKKVNFENIDRSLFESIDIRTTTQLTIEAKRVKVLSGAPSDSYTITKNGNLCVFTILDVERFWSVSRFLVLQLD